jgi:hypothetical protein
MISEKQFFKKIDDNTLIEDNPVNKDGRALKWQKCFEALYINLSDIRITSNFTINEIDHLSHTFKNLRNESEPKESIFKFIKPNASSSRILFGKCLDFDDKLYRLVKDSENSDLYKGVKLSGGIEVKIKECENEPQQDEMYPNGVYYGALFWFEEHVYDMEPFVPQIECLIPTSQMNYLIDFITKTPSPEIEISIEVLSFECEMDKMMSEPWMSKVLLLEERSPALLKWINVSSLIPNHSKKIVDDPDNNKKDPLGLRQNNKILKNLTPLIWIAATLLIFEFFK